MYFILILICWPHKSMEYFIIQWVAITVIIESARNKMLSDNTGLLINWGFFSALMLISKKNSLSKRGGSNFILIFFTRCNFEYLLNWWHKDFNKTFIMMLQMTDIRLISVNKACLDHLVSLTKTYTSILIDNCFYN